MTVFGLFNYDGPVVQTLNKVADGIRHGEGHIWHEYWHSFLSNFKQVTLLWLPLALIYGALGASCYSCYLMCSAGNLPKEMLYFLLIVSAVITTWAASPSPSWQDSRTQTE